MASLKMWFRDKQALFWSMLLPLLFMVIFGLMNFGALGRVDLGVVNLANSPASQGMLEALKSIEAVDITYLADRQTALAALEEGERDLVLVVPPGFGASIEPLDLEVLFNEGRPRESQVGLAVLGQVLDELTFRMSDASRLFVIDATPSAAGTCATSTSCCLGSWPCPSCRWGCSASLSPSSSSRGRVSCAGSSPRP